MDNRLDLMDQASFLGWRALGHQPMLHFTWLYDRPVDLQGLERFAAQLNRGRLARGIERARVWGGRDRWVALERPVPLEIHARPRPRDQAQRWSMEVSRRPIDPQVGPPWRLATTPLTDGGAAVALVISHTTADGGASLLAIAEAVSGEYPQLDLPRRGARGRVRGLIAGLGEALRGLRGVIPALCALRRGRRESGAVGTASPPAAVTRPEGVPERDAAIRVIVLVAEEAWQQRARELGGTSNALCTAFAAAMGRRLGRTLADGTVNLTLPVSQRTDPQDLRGNALTAIVVNVDPTGAVEDLRPVRGVLKAAYGRPDSQLSMLAALPLVPFVPEWGLRRAEAAAVSADVQAMGCSNIDRVPQAVELIDGAPAQFMYGQFNEPGRRTVELERMGGQGFVGLTLSGGCAVLDVVCFRSGELDDEDWLREQVEQELTAFGLRAEPMRI